MMKKHTRVLALGLTFTALLSLATPAMAARQNNSEPFNPHLRVRHHVRDHPLGRHPLLLPDWRTGESK